MNFGEYLKQLRKEKSISQRGLAEKSGVSNAELSRIETGERQKISPDVLRAIAPVLEVPYEELMDNAGYLNTRASFMVENKEAVENFITILTPKLFMNGWKVEPSGIVSQHDIVAKKGEDEWLIDFKYFRTREDDETNFRYDMITRDYLFGVYGRIAIYDKTPITRFTLVVNNKKIYEIILNYPPKMLKVHVSVMLINLEEGKIIEEQFLT